MVIAKVRIDREGERQRSTPFAPLCTDEASFRAWYDAALPRVYGFVYGRAGGDVTLADEITQKAFVAAIKQRSAFDGRSDPVVWVCSIARNALVDHYRRRMRESRRHLALLVREIAVDGDARAWDHIDERDEILEALRGLTPDQRSAVFL